MLLRGGRLVKTIRFEKYRDVGDPVKSSSVYNSQTSDEIILLNIEKKGDRIGQIAQVLPQISKVCFMPLTVGALVPQGQVEIVHLLLKGGVRNGNSRHLVSLNYG